MQTQQFKTIGDILYYIKKYMKYHNTELINYLNRTQSKEWLDIYGDGVCSLLPNEEQLIPLLTQKLYLNGFTEKSELKKDIYFALARNIAESTLGEKITPLIPTSFDGCESYDSNFESIDSLRDLLNDFFNRNPNLRSRPLHIMSYGGESNEFTIFLFDDKYEKCHLNINLSNDNNIPYQDLVNLVYELNALNKNQ